MKIRKLFSLKFLILAAMILSLAIGFTLPSSLPEGTIYKTGAKEEALTLIPATASSPSVPTPVVEGVKELAQEMYGNYREKYNKFIDQVLAMYLEVKDKDFAIVFNPGGWGWAPLEASPGWDSISTGITDQLEDMGYTSTMLDYQRTERTASGAMDEFVSMFSFRTSRAEDLAYRINFLTKYIPGLHVIIAGESNGTVYSDHVMTLLKNNPNVFSIQTGPPFWHRYVTLSRTLLLKNNGETDDSFSQGDLFRVLWANLKHWFGFSEGNNGTIMNIFQAPGHFYSWDTEVAAQISHFLKSNFSD